MATGTRARRGAKTTKKAAPAPEPEVVEDEEIEDLEEPDELDEEDDEPEEKPKKKAPAAGKKATAKKKVEEVTNGTQWLADHVNGVLGTEYKTFDLRVALRKLASKGTLQRDVGAERARYSFSGPKDPVVVALIKMLRSGELEKDKRAKLDELKAKGREKSAKKKAAKANDEDVDEDLTDEDVDELDEDE